MAVLNNPQALYAVAEEIGLSSEEQHRLVGPSNAEFMAEAIRIGIALIALWPDRQIRTRWLGYPNKAFDGRSGRKLLVSEDIEDVRLLRKHSEYWAYNGW